MPAIDLTSMADHQDEHQYFFVLNVAYESVRPNPILPPAKQFPSQRCAMPTRIFFRGDLLSQITYNLNLYLPVKLAQLFFGGIRDFNPPGQVRAPIHREYKSAPAPIRRASVSLRKDRRLPDRPNVRVWPHGHKMILIGLTVWPTPPVVARFLLVNVVLTWHSPF